MKCDPRCDFAGSYEHSNLPAVKAVERKVLGCDYGGTSWTTADQVPHIVTSLKLDAKTRLLEAGCGSGWPGLYLSQISECKVTLLDVPLNAVQQAGDRAQQDDLTQRVRLVNGSATALPFAAATFDCVSHSDVLCCLGAKRKMLEECRRVIRTSGRMHFSVITPGRGLDAAAHARALDVGPPFVDIDRPYGELLDRTGWRVLERLEVSAEYKDSLQRLITSLEADAGVLKDVYGTDEFADTLARRKEQARSVSAGILIRLVFVAVAA